MLGNWGSGCGRWGWLSTERMEMLSLTQSFVTCYVSGARPGSLQTVPSSLLTGPGQAKRICHGHQIRSKIFTSAVEAPVLLRAHEFSPRTAPRLRCATFTKTVCAPVMQDTF